MRCAAYTLQGKRCSRQATTADCMCTQHSNMLQVKGRITGGTIYNRTDICSELNIRPHELDCLLRDCENWLMPTGRGSGANGGLASFCEANFRHLLSRYPNSMVYSLLKVNGKGDIDTFFLKRFPQTAGEYKGIFRPPASNADTIRTGVMAAVVTIPPSEFPLGGSSRYFPPMGVDYQVACVMGKMANTPMKCIRVTNNGIWIYNCTRAVLGSGLLNDPAFATLGNTMEALGAALATPGAEKPIASPAEYVSRANNKLGRYIQVSFHPYKGGLPSKAHDVTDAVPMDLEEFMSYA